MPTIATIGLDLAKSVFQVHCVNGDGGVVIRRALRRSQFSTFFAVCRIVWSGSEPTHFALLGEGGLRFRSSGALIPPIYVKAYVKRGKTDAADAERSARLWRGRPCALCRSRIPNSRRRECSCAPATSSSGSVRSRRTPFGHR